MWRGGEGPRMAQQFVNSKLKADKVVVFGKSSCPYCHDAVKLLEGLHLKPGHFEYVDLTTRSDMSAIQDYLLEITGARTVSFLSIILILAREEEGKQ